MRSQRRSTIGWILAPVALATALLLPVGASAQVKTGQAPDCRRFCMSVKPREAPEGSVFTFRGRHWRPNRRVRVSFGVYCRPGEACIDILYTALLRTGERGRFTFRLRAGQERPGDEAEGIRAGGQPTFAQRAGGRTVKRRPRYRVLIPPS